MPLAGLDFSPPDFLEAGFAASVPDLAPGVVAIVRDANDPGFQRAADLDYDQDVVAGGGEDRRGVGLPGLGSQLRGSKSSGLRQHSQSKFLQEPASRHCRKNFKPATATLGDAPE